MVTCEDVHKTDSNIHHGCIFQDDCDCAALFHKENWVSIKVRVLGTYQVSGLKDVPFAMHCLPRW